MKPMLCQKATIEEARQLQGEWTVQEKYDGIRGIIKGGRLFDRWGADITQKFPEFVGLELIEPTLDGEIIAQSGEFNDVSGRVHMKDVFMINLLAKKSPAIFVAFDVPEVGGVQKERLANLQFAKELVEKWKWIQVAQGMSLENLDAKWVEVCELGKEGLVLKRMDGFYEPGKRSAAWLKVKTFTETTATFTKLENHNRGVRLETADGKSVNVNGMRAEEVVFRFKRDGKVVCEVQYLPQKDSDAWRFPSFRGLI